MTSTNWLMTSSVESTEWASLSFLSQASRNSGLNSLPMRVSLARYLARLSLRISALSESGIASCGIAASPPLFWMQRWLLLRCCVTVNKNPAEVLEEKGSTAPLARSLCLGSKHGVHQRIAYRKSLALTRVLGGSRVRGAYTPRTVFVDPDPTCLLGFFVGYLP